MVKLINILQQLLGRSVYSSNNQLGGVQIMYNNGVTHKAEGKNLFHSLFLFVKLLKKIVFSI